MTVYKGKLPSRVFAEGGEVPRFDRTPLKRDDFCVIRFGVPICGTTPRSRALFNPTPYRSGAPICPAVVCGRTAAGLDDVRDTTGQPNQRARYALWESRPLSYRDVVPWGHR